MIPVMRPRLPSAAQLAPYLKRIDAARLYSNWGPLNGELERRLSRHFGLPENSVVTAATGTAALVAGIIAVAGRATAARPLAIVPAYTFVATALAVEQCGYEPFLADIDAGSWMLDPQRLRADVELRRVGLVVPVAPLGRPVAQAPWQEFQRHTRIPVVIDGAACFECAARAPQALLGRIPVALSFHATKSFATGEGGCVISSNANMIRAAARALNFGFDEARDCRSASINGKLSEYHAAIGLAELDGWDAKQAAFARVTARYRRMFARAGLADRFVAAPDIASCYAVYACDGVAESERISAALRARDVDFRLWYGSGLQDQTYLRRMPRERLTVTRRLAPRLVGLPVATDLQPAVQQRVVDALRTAASR